jgi:hypothetical protein
VTNFLQFCTGTSLLCVVLLFIGAAVKRVARDSRPAVSSIFLTHTYHSYIPHTTHTQVNTRSPACQLATRALLSTV